MNRGLFFWVGTRALLPEGWRWFSACVRVGRNDDGLIYLAESAFTRLQRALEARDVIHRTLNQPHNNDAAEVVLSNLDIMLMTLMGALDVTARVAHRVLRLPAADEFQAGCQRGRWLEPLGAVDADLERMFAPGTWHRSVAQLLARLRNAVHAAAPSPLGVMSHGFSRDGTLVGFPDTGADELSELFDRLGGRAEWGVRSVIPGRAHVDPSHLVEQLMPAAIALINAVMAGTPVERLIDEPLNDGDCAPPEDKEFEAWKRQSIVRQVKSDVVV